MLRAQHPRKDTMRVSMEPAALAVAFDPQRSSAEALAFTLQKKLRVMKVSVLLLRAPQANKQTR